MKKLLLIVLILFQSLLFSQSYWQGLDPFFYNKFQSVFIKTRKIILQTEKIGLFSAAPDNYGVYYWSQYGSPAKNITGFAGNDTVFCVSSLDQSMKIYDYFGNLIPNTSIPGSPPLTTVYLAGNKSIFAGTNRNGFYYSTAIGNQWNHNKLDSSTTNCFFWMVYSGYYFAGTDKGIYMSTGSIPEWGKVDVSPKCKINAISNFANNDLFAATDSGLYRSSDWGHTWFITALKNLKCNCLYSSDGALYIGTDDGIWATKNKGASVYKLLYENTKIKYLSGSLILTEKDIYSGGSFASGTMYSWHSSNKTYQGLPESYILDIIADTDSSNYFLTTDALFWRDDSVNIPVNCNNGLPEKITKSILRYSDSLFILALDTGDIYKSKSPKIKWDYCTRFNKSLKKLIKIGDSDIYGLSDEGNIYISKDTANTWMPIITTDSIVANSIVKAGNNLVVSSNIGVLYSSDSGLSWHNSNAPRLQMTNISCTNVNTLYVASITGAVYYSNDMGKNWHKTSTDLPNLLTSIYAKNDGNIFVGTSGQGVYYSYDNGVNWVSCNIGLYAGYIRQFNLLPNDYLYVIPRGSRVFKTKLLPTGIDEKIIVQNKNELKQNYPNPFSNSTHIAFTLSNPSKVKIELFNLLGECIEVLCDKEFNSGENEILFNAGKLSSGVYLYRITTQRGVGTKKMIIIN